MQVDELSLQAGQICLCIQYHVRVQSCGLPGSCCFIDAIPFCHKKSSSGLRCIILHVLMLLWKIVHSQVFHKQAQASAGAPGLSCWLQAQGRVRFQWALQGKIYPHFTCLVPAKKAEGGSVCLCCVAVHQLARLALASSGCCSLPRQRSVLWHAVRAAHPFPSGCTCIAGCRTVACLMNQQHMRSGHEMCWHILFAMLVQLQIGRRRLALVVYPYHLFMFPSALPCDCAGWQRRVGSGGWTWAQPDMD